MGRTLLRKPRKRSSLKAMEGIISWYICAGGTCHLRESGSDGDGGGAFATISKWGRPVIRMFDGAKVREKGGKNPPSWTSAKKRVGGNKKDEGGKNCVGGGDGS